MTDKTVTIDGTDVRVFETENGGFDAEVATTDPIDEFKDAVVDEGDSISWGTVSDVAAYGGNVTVTVSNADTDVLGATVLDDAFDAGWRPNKIEFEAGYVIFTQFDTGVEDDDHVAVPASAFDGDEDGYHLRAESDDGYGFEIPVGGPYALEPKDRYTNAFYAVWDTTVDSADELSNDGVSPPDDSNLSVTDVLDGHALVTSIEIVDR